MLYLKENKNLIIRRSLSLLLLAVCFIIQNSGFWLPGIFGVNALILIPAVVCIAVFERETWGAVSGLFAGVLWDAVSPRGQGYHAIVLMLIGFFCGFLVRYLMRSSLLSVFCLSALAVLIHNLLFWLFFFVFAGTEGSVYALIRIYLPSALYTLLFLPVFYYPCRAVSRALCRREQYLEEADD